MYQHTQTAVVALGELNPNKLVSGAKTRVLVSIKATRSLIHAVVTNKYGGAAMLANWLGKGYEN